MTIPPAISPLLATITNINYFFDVGCYLFTYLIFIYSPDLEGKPLEYFFMLERKSMDEKTTAPENGGRLWKLSEGLLKDLGIEFKKSF